MEVSSFAPRRHRVLWLVVGLAAAAAGRGEGGVIDLPTAQRQLFLDDQVVERTEGLKTTLHAPEKRGPVIRPDIPSDGNRVQTYGTSPMWVPDERVYKMVYMAFPVSEEGDSKEIGPALAISKDGIHWEKPNLGQGVSVLGSTANNRIQLDPKRSWTNERDRGNGLWNVIYDAAEADPKRRFKALVGIQGRTPAVSGDAVHWEEIPGVAIPSSDTSSLGFDPARRRFLAFVKGKNQFGRAVMLSVSEDFQHWSEPRLCFGADEADQPLAVETIRRRVHDRRLELPLFVDPDPALGFRPPEHYIPTWRAECYAFTAFAYEGLFIGLPMVYYPTGQALPDRKNTDGFHLIQLAMSRDLTEWKRLGERQAFIGPSRVDQGLVGVYDRSELTAPGAPVLVGDELRFYYTGFKSRTPPYALNPDGTPRDPSTLDAAERADLKDGWAAICLAVLRRDGFISLDAAAAPGVVVTRPLRWTGKKLCVNLAAGHGSARVEVLTENGEPIADFSGANAAVLAGDAVGMPVKFPGRRSLETLAHTPVRLRITLQHASLYAFWIED